MEILYSDRFLIVCVKPAGVLSTDEPGGVPSLARQALGDERADVRTVHRLDRVVGGVMLLARGADAAAALGRQVMDGSFQKRYLAVVHGAPEAGAGTFTDLLRRDRRECRTYVTDTPGKDAREAISDYTLLERAGALSLLRISLRTGRTHQIRAQFAHHGLPLVGDRKYGTLADGETPIALWSHAIAFAHPDTGAAMAFRLPPPRIDPWTEFSAWEETAP
ncbi:MAG: RluA family pseudouridine synthase [Ruminococcaceae bacterium]|nr:RluA family pseudouridine synthase [Oscillospiraceae bacterium]